MCRRVSSYHHGTKSCNDQWWDLFFIADEDLTVELLQLTSWLKFIGCPMSLVYRIARSFHFKFSLEIESIDIYLVNIRRFILESLSGIVLNSDFQALEVQLLNPQFNFGFILQRMWAFRGFRLARVPRTMCDIWFSAWTSYGYEYDIATFEDWNFDLENL